MELLTSSFAMKRATLNTRVEPVPPLLEELKPDDSPRVGVFPPEAEVRGIGLRREFPQRPTLLSFPRFMFQDTMEDQATPPGGGPRRAAVAETGSLH